MVNIGMTAVEHPEAIIDPEEYRRKRRIVNGDEDEQEEGKKVKKRFLAIFANLPCLAILCTMCGLVTMIALILGLGLGIGLKTTPTNTTSTSCTYDKYWNGSNCVPKGSGNDACTSTLQCQEYNQLSCRNSTCQCPDLPNYFWSTAGLACVQCPQNWTIYFGHCYVTNTASMSWASALAWCQSQNGATLMTIRNDAEYQLLYNFYTTFSPGGRLWIGAISNSTLWDFRWPDYTQLNRTSSWWCSGEPNNSGGNNALGIIREDCVFMWTSSGRVCFNDFACTSSEKFVCEKFV